MRCIAITILTCVILSTATALADSTALQACVDIYQNSTRDFSQADQTNIQLAHSFSSFCKKDGSVSTSATGVGLDAIVESIPFKFSLTSNTSDQKLSEFCRQGASEYDSWSSSSFASSTVVTSALANFNSCVQLATSGLQLVVAINQPVSLVVSGSSSAGYNGSITSIDYDSDLMTCRSADFNRLHKVETLHGPVHLSTAQPFSITCDKKGQVSADKKSTFYPRATLTIAAGAVSPLAVAFPSETLNGFELASQAQATVSQATAALAQANNTVDLERRAAVGLQQRLNNVSGQIVLHAFGSGTQWGCGPGGDWSG